MPESLLNISSHVDAHVGNTRDALCIANEVVLSESPQTAKYERTGNGAHAIEKRDKQHTTLIKTQNVVAIDQGSPKAPVATSASQDFFEKKGPNNITVMPRAVSDPNSNDAGGDSCRSTASDQTRNSRLTHMDIAEFYIFLASRWMDHLCGFSH